MGEERIYPISEFKKVPPKKIPDLFFQEQKGKRAAEKMLDWPGLVIGVLVYDFLPGHGFFIYC